KATGATTVSRSFNDFWFTQGNLQHAPFTVLSDPDVVWDEQVQRFIVGDQIFNNTHAMDPNNRADFYNSRFAIAISRSANPATLNAADWFFYQIDSSEANDWAD